MKTKIFITIGLIVSAAIIAFAQTDKKAKEILDKVSKQYKSYKTLEVSYSLFTKEKGAKPRVTRENGVLYLKGDKYMMATKDKDIYCNGDTIWTHDKVFGECNIENYSASKAEISPATIFTLHEKGFHYLLNGEATIGNEKFYQVDMTPINKKKPYYKVRLAIGKTSNHINRMIMMLRSADVTISVNNQKENTNISDSKFRYDPVAAGVPVVDLTSKKNKK